MYVKGHDVFFILTSGTTFSLANGGSVRVCICVCVCGGGGVGGAWFLYKEILGDHCPFGKYVVGVRGSSPRKILILMKQNRAILDSFGLNIHCLKRVLMLYFCKNACKLIFFKLVYL